jgi:hypothetical protein
MNGILKFLIRAASLLRAFALLARNLLLFLKFLIGIIASPGDIISGEDQRVKFKNEIIKEAK